MRIAINAGHHIPEDCGAQGSMSNEAELAYKYAQIVVDKLKADGHEVILICNNSLQGICNESNNFESDFFVSIHLNSCATPDVAYGTETFYYKNKETNKDSINGKRLATCLQESVENMMLKYRLKQRPNVSKNDIKERSNRGLKTDSLYVTGKHMDAAAALLEIGFINNKLEEDILLTYPEEIAQAIYNGIKKYIGEK